MGNYGTALYGGHVPLPLVVQKRIFSRAEASTRNKPFIIGILNHSHTDPDDFAGFAELNAQIIVAQSGVILQNVAMRTSIDKFVQRPINLWLMGAAHHSQSTGEYLLGEQAEAAISGSDGLVYWASDVLQGKIAEGQPTVDSTNPDPEVQARNGLEMLKAQIVECHGIGLSICVGLEGDEPIEPFLNEGYQPDAIFYKSRSQAAPYGEEWLEHVRQLRAKAADAGIAFISGIAVDDDTPSLSHVPPATAVVVEKFEILPSIVHRPTLPPLIKVCGIRTTEAALKALDSGASMIGMILAPGRTRTVDHAVAQQISSLVRNYKRKSPYDLQKLFNEDIMSKGSSVFDVNARVLRIKTMTRPLVVGVFRNQPLEEVLYLQHKLQLDIVQLHGSEPLEWTRCIPVPVIKRFTPGTPEFETCSMTGYHYLSLIDGEIGGEGKQQDWSAIKDSVAIGARFLLAGGMNETNVAEGLKVDGVIGVDVSGGVETNGLKDMGKIERFVTNAKHARCKY